MDRDRVVGMGRESGRSEDRAAPRRPAASPLGESSGLLRLQRLIGNQGVLALVGAQAALQVGGASDPLEREADSVAEQVVAHLRGDAVGRSITARQAEGPGLARSIRRRPAVSRQGVGPAGGAVDVGTERTLATEVRRGAPLDGAIRRSMEDAFGADFSRVRVHEGPTATDLNRSVGAKAFTLGDSIFFRGPAPSAATADGQRLLAHELAHTVQQGAAPLRRIVQRAGATEDHEAPEAESSEAVEGVIAEGEIKPTAEAKDGPPPGIEADGPVGPADGSQRGTRSNRSSGASSAGKAYRLNVSSIGLSTHDSMVEHVPQTDDEDAIIAEPKVTTSKGTHKEDDPFGALSRRWSTKSVAFKVAKDATSPSLTVRPTFALKTTWGVTSGGNTDIPSASSSKVKVDTYEKIVSDLTPQLNLKSWVAPRDEYWSKALCARHEKFHMTDVTTWAKQDGKAFAADYLGKKTVTLTDDERKSSKKIKAKLKPIVEDAEEALQEATNTYMRGVGNSYYAYPGEERAFGDGKAPYEALAAAVKVRGDQMKADKEKKDAAKLAKNQKVQPTDAVAPQVAVGTGAG